MQSSPLFCSRRLSKLARDFQHKVADKHDMYQVAQFQRINTNTGVYILQSSITTCQTGLWCLGRSLWTYRRTAIRPGWAPPSSPPCSGVPGTSLIYPWRSGPGWVCWTSEGGLEEKLSTWSRILESLSFRNSNARKGRGKRDRGDSSNESVSGSCVCGLRAFTPHSEITKERFISQDNIFFKLSQKQEHV